MAEDEIESLFTITASDFIFKGGDVKIKITIGDEVVIGSVCSQAMALASPVWDEFIFNLLNSADSASATPDSTFKKPKSSRVAVEEVNFAEDDAEALLLLLNIAHLKFKHIPTALDYYQLLDLAMLVDQYLCIDLVRPWLDGWIKQEFDESSVIGHENWLFIAWVFGMESTFERLASKLVREIKLDKEGNAFVKDGHPISHPLPPDILETILSVRLIVIQQLEDIPYTLIRRFDDSKSSLCVGPSNQAACDAITYGSLIRMLQVADLWPYRLAKDMSMNVNTIAAIVKGLRIHTFPNSPQDCQTIHYDIDDGEPCYSILAHRCHNSNFKAEIESVLVSIQSPVLDSHLRHMGRQREED